jgi:hypothetical protein
MNTAFNERSTVEAYSGLVVINSEAPRMTKLRFELFIAASAAVSEHGD